jgi:hypothetical protein
MSARRSHPEALPAVWQVEDGRFDEVVQNGPYPEATQEVLKDGGLWVNDEEFVGSGRHQ